MKIVKVLMLILCVMLLGEASAQNKNYTIDLYHYNGGEYVSLRWYPQTVQDYRHGSKGGFIVQRRIYSNGRAGDWKDLARVIASSYDDFLSYINNESNSGLIGAVIYHDEMQAKMKEYRKNSSVPDSMKKELDDSPLAQEYLYKLGLVECEFDWGLSKMAALCYKDETADRMENYDYRIVFADGKDVDKSKILHVDMAQLTVLPKPTSFDFTLDNNNVNFSWDVSSLKTVFTGYRLERSEDGKNFKPVNEKPIIHMYSDDAFANLCSYHDTLPKCDKDYYYRMCGICNFGFLGPYSNVVKVRCVSDYLVDVWIDTVTMSDKNIAELRWTVKNPKKQKINGFLVQRAEKLNLEKGKKEVEFVSLNNRPLSPNATSFRDEKTLQTNYYRVLAFGNDTSQISASNVYFSHQIDSIPPAPPVGLKGTIDSAGVVTLTWEPNKEPDIYAYRVFFSNSKDVEFMGCSDTFLKTPYFTDTLFLGSLTNDIYYKTMALDINFNQSAMSEAVRLEKPDTIAPAKAVFMDINQDSTGNMNLLWENSPSIDLQKVELYRRLSDVGNFELLATWTDSAFASAYVDTFKFNGENVYYNIITYDHSGNKALTEGVPVKCKSLRQECLKNLRYEIDYQKGGVRLVWDKSGCNISKIWIFRSVNGKTKLLDTILGAERSYFDKEVYKGEKYKYIIQPVTEKQSKTISTEEFIF
ncbi:MAG TPA: hypothetical protein PKZ15_11090 [Paludibacteraceae bacterium]|nr:hypothetical protein [Paludibacteraceae bacterium]